MKIAISYLSSPTAETISKIEKTDADYIHVDIMDGKFVETKNDSMKDVNKLLTGVAKPLDVHLMVSNPAKYIEAFAMLPTETITFHLEAVTKPYAVIEKIKNIGLKVGMSINPETKVSAIIPFLSELDEVLIMSVHPGKGGQAFMDEILYKIEALRDLKKENQFHYLISVDGGIDAETVLKVKEAGADMVVSGSYVTRSDDYQAAIESLK